MRRLHSRGPSHSREVRGWPEGATDSGFICRPGQARSGGGARGTRVRWVGVRDRGYGYKCVAAALMCGTWPPPPAASSSKPNSQA